MAYTPETQKIDKKAVDGLVGVNNSLAYKVNEIEKHLHNSEQWFGNNLVLPLNGNFTRASLVGFRLTAGSGLAYGTEVQIYDGTTIEGGSAVKQFDLHRTFIAATSNNSVIYKVELYYGTTTFAESILLTEIIMQTPSNQMDALPVEIITPRITCNNKIWARIKCVTNAATIDLLFGLHTYKA